MTDIYFSQFVGWQVQDQGASKIPLPCLQMTSFMLHSYMNMMGGEGEGEREREGEIVLWYLYKTTNSIMSIPPSQPHLNLISSPKSHLQIPSHWIVDHQHIHSGLYKHSVHINGLTTSCNECTHRYPCVFETWSQYKGMTQAGEGVRGTRKKCSPMAPTYLECSELAALL